MKRVSKDRYYLGVADSVRPRSTCMRRTYGAIIVKNDEIISTGYNGAPRDEINCCDCGFCQREALGIPKGERYELCVAVHAEANAIISAARRDMIGATIYIVGRESDGFYANPAPCMMCRRLIKNAGITKCIGNVNGVPTEIPLDPPEMEVPTPKDDEVSNPTKETEDPSKTDCRLAGGYVAVTTYASREMIAENGLENEDECPTVVLAIREDFLTKFATENGWKSLDDLLENYTFDNLVELEEAAGLADALAFVYGGSQFDETGPFPYFNLHDSNAVMAYTDFLSELLQDQGHEKASKSIDCMFEL